MLCIKIIGGFKENNLRLLRLGGTILNLESRKNLTEKMECEKRPKRAEKMDHEAALGASIPLPNPEVGAHLPCLWDSREASMGGAVGRRKQLEMKSK